jgi:hypothetical protein
MANRLNAPNQFETLSPPWLLVSLDTNFVQNQSAWNDSSLGFVNAIPVDTGSANNYQVTLPFGSPSAYQDGMSVIFIPANTNTGGSTLTVSPLGSVSILNPAGIALSGGEIAANRALIAVYKSAVPTGFRIVGSCAAYYQFLATTGNHAVECAGYTSVDVLVSWTATTSTAITLNHLAAGTLVGISFINGSGTTNNYGVLANDPSGTTFIEVGTVGAVLGSAYVDLTTGLATLPSANRAIFTGVAGVQRLYLS